MARIFFVGELNPFDLAAFTGGAAYSVTSTRRQRLEHLFLGTLGGEDGGIVIRLNIGGTNQLGACNDLLGMLIRHDFRFDLDGKNTQFLLGNQAAVRLQQGGQLIGIMHRRAFDEVPEFAQQRNILLERQAVAGERLPLAVTIDGAFIHDIAGFPPVVGFDFCE